MRPEPVRLDDAGPVRAGAIATVNLGTTQIVTLDAAFGQVEARLSARDPVAVGGQTGLDFDARRMSGLT